VNRLEAALLDVVGFLDAQRVPYAVIGGFANLHWGRPRLTQDLDLKISLDDSAWATFVAEAGKHFKLRPEQPLEMLRDLRVLPIATRTGVRVDLIVAGLPYEESAIRRAVPVDVSGTSVRLCTAEDLILHKIVSERSRDRDDVEGIIARQGTNLDLAYLDPLVEELARGLENPDLLEFYRTCWSQAGE
jgi:Nucleotidyl transferase of unknown function (DUF2204)